MNSFTYYGVSSESFGIHIEQKNVFSGPEYDMEFKSIPGRSGDIISSNNRFQNVTVAYTCFIKRATLPALAQAIRDIKAWLYSGIGEYHLLKDTYDDQYERYGTLRGSVDIEEQLNKVGSFTVFFSCRPFKYRIDGMSQKTYSATSVTLNNPEAFESKPVFIVNGTGDITLVVSNSKKSYSETITIKSLASSVVIDSEKMNCYKGSTLLNSSVSFKSSFPVLPPGENTVKITGSGFSSISIVPRWCTL